MYKNVVVVFRGEGCSNQSLMKVSGVAEGDDILLVDRKTNAVEFLIDQSALESFIARLQQNGIYVIRRDKTENNLLLIVSETSGGNLRQLDDQRAQDLWNK